MAEERGPWEIEYYETRSGNVPVFEWIKSLPGEGEEAGEGEKPETDRGPRPRRI